MPKTHDKHLSISTVKNPWQLIAFMFEEKPKLFTFIIILLWLVCKNFTDYFILFDDSF